MLLYAHKRLKLQQEKQSVSQTQKNKDSDTNINVSPISESVQSGTLNDQKRKRRRKRSKRRMSSNSSGQEKNNIVISKLSKKNKAHFIFPKMVANRVAPSTEVVVSISNEMKKKCATLERNYDHLVERILIYEIGHCYVSKNKTVIPA